MAFYPSLDMYNADVKAARDAYNADQEVAAGGCEKRCGRRRDGRHRTCRTCRRHGAKS